MEIIYTAINDTTPNTITVAWRLSGSVNIGLFVNLYLSTSSIANFNFDFLSIAGPGLNIKPYVVFTDLTISPKDGLIVKQKDRFSIPGYDIVLSALFPFLIGNVLKPSALPIQDLKREYKGKTRQ